MDAFRHRRDARAASRLKAEIVAALAGIRSAADSPYFKRLSDALEHTGELRLLREGVRTLHLTDGRESPQSLPDAPLVSIVMPVHDRQDVVGEAIRSALAQSYTNFELIVCDDASSDGTPDVLRSFADDRIRILAHPVRRGAAAARNTCLASARGGCVAYLDSDNLWHPLFLQLAMAELRTWPGHQSVCASFFDLRIDADGRPVVKDAVLKAFDLEDQIEKPYVDLNSFVHRRGLVNLFGGFDERLLRRQDYDLIARYAWLGEPRHIPLALNLYQRSARLAQITQVQGGDLTAPAIIGKKIADAYQNGLPARFPPWLKKVTVVSWDMSRNHFAKAFSVAEALSRQLEVELVSFRFFEDPIFAPLAASRPDFATHYFGGADFPAFFQTMDDAVQAISGDAIYAVKPRLPSLGLALLANARSATPVFLEANDLETVVSAPRRGDLHHDLPLGAILDHAEAARVPHAEVWSRVLDRCAQELPTLFTHNANLDAHYGRRCLLMRNVKDQRVFDPRLVDRSAIRAELGFGMKDRIILFGGLVRRHKGIFELAEFVRRMGAPYKLLVVGSRETPDLRAFNARARAAVTLLPPQTPERMAELNAAADVVVLWLDPAVPASYYQSPYKMTDALAMGAAIVASPIGDFPRLAERGLVWTVPYGDFFALASTIGCIFADGAERERRRAKAQRVFLREYSYHAVGPAVALAASLIDRPRHIYPIAAEFGRTMAEFRARLG